MFNDVYVLIHVCTHDDDDAAPRQWMMGLIPPIGLLPHVGGMIHTIPQHHSDTSAACQDRFMRGARHQSHLSRRAETEFHRDRREQQKSFAGGSSPKVQSVTTGKWSETRRDSTTTATTHTHTHSHTHFRNLQSGCVVNHTGPMGCLLAQVLHCSDHLHTTRNRTLAA